MAPSCCSGRIITLAEADSVTDKDFWIKLNGNDGPFDAALPSAIGRANQGFLFMRLDDGEMVNSVRIVPKAASGQTINGRTNWPVNQAFQEVLVKSDGANWFVQSDFSFGLFKPNVEIDDGDAFQLNPAGLRNIMLSGDGDITLNNAATILDGVDGQELFIQYGGVSGSLTFRSEFSLSGSNLYLGDTTRIIAPNYGFLALKFNAASGRWCETGYNGGLA